MKVIMVSAMRYCNSLLCINLLWVKVLYIILHLLQCLDCCSVSDQQFPVKINNEILH